MASTTSQAWAEVRAADPRTPRPPRAPPELRGDEWPVGVAVGAVQAEAAEAGAATRADQRTDRAARLEEGDRQVRESRGRAGRQLSPGSITGAPARTTRSGCLGGVPAQLRRRTARCGDRRVRPRLADRARRGPRGATSSARTASSSTHGHGSDPGGSEQRGDRGARPDLPRAPRRCRPAPREGAPARARAPEGARTGRRRPGPVADDRLASRVARTRASVLASPRHSPASSSSSSCSARDGVRPRAAAWRQRSGAVGAPVEVEQEAGVSRVDARRAQRARPCATPSWSWSALRHTRVSAGGTRGRWADGRSVGHTASLGCPRCGGLAPSPGRTC